MTVSVVDLKDYLPQHGFNFTDINFLSVKESQHDILILLFQSFYYLKSNINRHQQFITLIETYFNKLMKEYEASDLTAYIIQLIEHLKSSKLDVQKINSEINIILLQFCQEFILCQQKVNIAKPNALLENIASELGVQIREFYPTFKLLLLLSYYHNINKVNITNKQKQELERLVDTEFQFSIMLTAKTQIESTGLPPLFQIHPNDNMEVMMIKQLLQHPNVNNQELIKQFKYNNSLPSIQQIQEFKGYNDEIIKIMMQFRMYIEQKKMQQAIYKCNQLLYLLQSPAQQKKSYYYYEFLLFLNKKVTVLTLQKNDNRYQEFLVKNVQRDDFTTNYEENTYIRPNFKVLLLLFCTIYQTDFDQFLLDQLLIDMEELPTMQFDYSIYTQDIQRGKQSPIISAQENQQKVQPRQNVDSASPQSKLSAPKDDQTIDQHLVQDKSSFFSDNVDMIIGQNDDNTLDLTKTANTQLLHQITHPNIEINELAKADLIDYQILVFLDDDSDTQKFIKAFLSQNIYKIGDIEQKYLPQSLQDIYTQITSKEAFQRDYKLEQLPAIQNTTFAMYSLWEISDLMKNDVLFEDFVIENCHKRFNCETIYNKYIIDGCSFIQIVQAARAIDLGQKVHSTMVHDYNKWYQEQTNIQKRLSSHINPEKVEEAGDNIIGYLHEIATSGVIQLDRIQAHVEKVTKNIENLEQTVNQIQVPSIKQCAPEQITGQPNVKLLALKIALQNIKSQAQ